MAKYPVLLLLICSFIFSCASAPALNKNADNPLGLEERCYLKRCVAENWLEGGSYGGTLPPNISLVKDLPGKKIVYRSGRISAPSVPYLKKAGIKTIISLSSVDEATAEAIRAAGLTHKKIRLASTGLNADNIQRVIDEINRQSGPLLVHCRAGTDRTGMVIACLRAYYGQNDHAKLFKEMRTNCHITLKKYRYYHELLDWFIDRY